MARLRVRAARGSAKIRRLTGYVLHGLRLASELPLGDPTELGEPPDVEITWSTGPVRPSHDAELVGTAPDPDRPFFELHEDAGGWTLRAPVAEFAARLSRDLRAIEVARVPGRDGLAAVITGGAVLGLLLDLRGEIALHASAVAIGGAAVAFTGPVGAGKTTVAALTCAAGAALVADDLLRVDVSDTVRCHRGASTLRLRDHALPLADAPRVVEATRTADDRTALRFPPAASSTLPLRAIVLPRPSREFTRVAVARLPRPRALALLAVSARYASWRSPAALAAQFHRAAELEARVPVLAAELPWTTPPPLRLGEEILHALDAA